MSEPSLFVVATPIGNLEDISPRALRILGQVDCIVAEDTRHTAKLLRHFGIDTPLQALHEHNERQTVPVLVRRMQEGTTLALVSDAGTPLVSDPGFRLVREAAGLGLVIQPVPGPSALTAALSVAGLPTDRFAFEGFPPARESARRRFLENLRREPRTLVLFESGHRILDCLGDLAGTLGTEREAVVCRELTKQFETVYRGTLEFLAGRLAASPEDRKGEFVLVVAGCRAAADSSLAEASQLARALLEYLPASQAARVAARIHGANRREVYQALEQGQGTPRDE